MMDLKRISEGSCLDWVLRLFQNISRGILRRWTKVDIRQSMQRLMVLLLLQQLVCILVERVMKRLELNGVDMAEVTLHTGLGTFRSIEVEDLSKHRMDAEFYMVNNQAVETINTALDAGKRICSIGTTSMRAIESSVSAYGRLKEGQGWTNLFVYPPFDFSIANSMLTNFHLPKSSLIIMVCAFGGYDLIMKAYEEAIKEKYRFYSYGDAMLIL